MLLRPRPSRRAALAAQRALLAERATAKELDEEELTLQKEIAGLSATAERANARVEQLEAEAKTAHRRLEE